MLNRPGRRSRPPVLRILGTILALGLLIYLLGEQGWDEIGRAIRQVSAWRLILVLGLTFMSRLAVSGRWHVLLRSAGLKIPAWQTARITFAGLFASNFLPTTVGGDVVRLAGALRLGYDRAICLASLVVDRLVGMAGMAMAGIPVLFFLPRLLSQLSLLRPDMTWIRVGTYSARGSGWASPRVVLAGVAYGGWVQRMKGLATRVWRRLLEALLVWLRSPQALLGSMAFTWVHMLCVFGSIWLLLPSLGERMPFWLVAGLWSLTYFITLLPISINGLGVQELSMTFLFTTAGGVSATSALTLALFMRVLPMFASLPGALFIPEMLAGVEKKYNT